MPKDCIFRIAETNKNCTHANCEQYIKYMIGTKIDEVEVAECVFVTIAKLQMPFVGARPIVEE